MASRHTPFDSLVLAAVVAEGQEWVGARIQKVWQPEPLVVVMSLYYGVERFLLLSAEADSARVHLVSRRVDGSGDLPAFCTSLRKSLTDGRVVFVRQRGLDRILEIGVSSSAGDFQIVAELMGKHSNIMLVDSSRKTIAAAKWVGKSQSKRPVLPGQLYEPPPFEPRPLLTKASAGDDLREFEGWSPFLGRLMEAGLTL
ncbi:MAG: NFACT family protein, partial [Armatimonadetes bacterium]|nr:NFACT family protein [Armatimonadota bacterium]